MANIPGATNVLPGVFTSVVTESRGTAIAGGLRVPAIIGEGQTNYTIVSAALGGGKDGLNPTYTSSSGADGRHFLLGNFPVVSNRTTLFRNGIALRGVEGTINSSSFPTAYDYRLDPSNGRIEMQSGYLQDLGGALYLPFSTNVGDGYVSYLSGFDGYGLIDSNAPRETWSIRCISVQRTTGNAPIPGTAKFIAVGSVSGNKLDANGKQVIWTSDGIPASNGILRFAIDQTVGSTALREGDGFTIKVNSGQLVKNDSLTASYIPESYLNDPIQLQGFQDVVNRFGNPSTSNTLSLGAQLAFANQSPSVMALQAAPPIPRKTSVIVSEAVKSNSTLVDDFVFPLPLGAVPDPEGNIQFFVVDNATGIETQVLPNQYEYYTLSPSSNPSLSQFIFSNTAPPGGYNFSYSLIKNYDGYATVASGFDGYIARNPSGTGTTGIFSVDGVTFTADFVGKTLKLYDATNSANNAEYTVNSVSEGKLYVTVNAFQNFSTETGDISFQVVNPVTLAELPAYTGDGSLTVVGTTAIITPNLGVTFDASVVGKRFKITASTANPENSGLFDITAYDSFTGTITIEKAVVVESSLSYEVLDPDLESVYVVINKSVVPDGYGLRVGFVDVKDASFYDAGWINALDALEKVEVDIVVPLPTATISVIFQNALAHCQTMSNIRNKKERVLFIGAIAGLKPENLIGSASNGTNTPVAVENIGILEGIQGDNPTEVLSGNVEDLANYSVSDAFGGTYRCVYFYPDQIVVQAGADNVLIDGFYIAAAAAGYLAAQTRIEMPLTNKVLSGFTILRDKLFSTLTLESLASSGVTTLQPVQGGGRVVWGITTSQSGFVEEQEISIVFIRDRIAKSMRSSFAGFVGLPESQDTASVLSARAVVVLNSFINQGLITAYANLSVQRDSVDPTQWNIGVKVQPTYPVNFIYIRVGVGTI